MLIITRTLTRPSLDIQFLDTSNLEYMALAQDPNSFEEFVTIEYSQDQLVKTITMTITEEQSLILDSFHAQHADLIANERYRLARENCQVTITRTKTD